MGVCGEDVGVCGVVVCCFFVVRVFGVDFISRRMDVGE